MLMDYTISPTKCSLSVMDACLYPFEAFPPTISDLRLELSAMHISLPFISLLLQVAESLFAFSHEC